MKWSLIGEFPEHLKKFVIIVVPHTSWWDFFLGLIVRKIWNQEINYIAKKSLFDSPLGWFFRWTGGAPIDRSKSNDTVKAIAAIFNERKLFRLALSPEGTRKKVKEWKTGFYFIAKTADVPVVLVAFDYGKKQIRISSPYILTSDMDGDFQKYKAFFIGALGKIPENSF